MFLNQRKTIDMLTMNETAELCVLGILFEDARNVPAMMTVIRNLDTGSWQPTTEVVEMTLERLMADKFIISFVAGREVYFSVTGSGIKQYFSLIKRPLQAGSSMSECTIALKSCFLESVPTKIRKYVVNELIGYYSCKLKGLETSCESCPLRSARMQVQQGHQINQIRHELDWLGSVIQA